MALAVSTVWCIIVNAAAIVPILWSYDLEGDTLSATEPLFEVAFFPAKVAFDIIETLPGMPVYSEAPWLYWLLIGGLVTMLLLGAGVAESAIMRRIMAGRRTSEV
jgi:hypothetical protein